MVQNGGKKGYFLGFWPKSAGLLVLCVRAAKIAPESPVFERFII